MAGGGGRLGWRRGFIVEKRNSVFMLLILCFPKLSEHLCLQYIEECLPLGKEVGWVQSSPGSAK